MVSANCVISSIQGIFLKVSIDIVCDFNDYAIVRSILVHGLKTAFLPQKSV